MSVGLFGADMPLAARVAVGLLIGLAVALPIAWAIRRSGTRRIGSTTPRSRQRHLAVIEAAVVDAHRRLILIRRDNTEHLMIIGGGADVVIEANIARVATPREAEAPHSPATGDTLSASDKRSDWRPDHEPVRREPPPPLPTPRLAEQTSRPEAPVRPHPAPSPPSPPIQRNPQEPDERLARVAEILARPQPATQASELRAPRRQVTPMPAPRQRMLSAQPAQSPATPPRVPERTNEISEAERF
jgi:flagellar protein FliO/FliZ